MKARTVLPQIMPPNEARFHALLVQGLARLSTVHGRGRLADAMGRSGRQLDNVFAGADPKAKALFDALLLDVTALDEVLAAYGMRIIPAADAREDDMALAAGISAGLTTLIESNADGVRDYRETLSIAAIFRPHMGALTRIIHEADALTRPRD